MSDEQLVSYFALFTVTGLDTLAHAVGNAVWFVGNEPSLFARIRRSPSLADAAFAEAMRLWGPIRLCVRRIDTNLMLGHREVSAGETLLILIHAANRDPARFPAGAFAAYRSVRRPELAYGLGRHGCLGGSVAQLVGRELLRSLAVHCRALDVDPGPESELHSFARDPRHLSRQACREPGGGRSRGLGVSYGSGSRPASADQNVDLARAVDLGTPPFERLRIGSVERTTRAGRDGAQRWREAATTNDRCSADLALAARGLTPSDLERAFSADGFVGRELPRWVRDLTSFLDALPAAALRKDDFDNGSGLVASTSLVPVATRLLDWQTLVEQFAYLDPKLVARLAEQLSLRLVIGCAAVLELRRPTRRSRRGIRARGLARSHVRLPSPSLRIGYCSTRVAASRVEMIVRLGADLDRLRSGTVSVRRRRADSSTREPTWAIGTTTAKCRRKQLRDDGSKVVYKPKSGRSAATLPPR